MLNVGFQEIQVEQFRQGYKALELEGKITNLSEQVQCAGIQEGAFAKNVPREGAASTLLAHFHHHSSQNCSGIVPVCS